MGWLSQVIDPANLHAFVSHFESDLQRPVFWLAVGKIVWVNLLLSGDNALVIAMACRGLQGRHRLWGLVIGAGIAVVLLIGFTGTIATLISLPYLKSVAGVLLLLIAAKLLVPETEPNDIVAGATLWQAVRIILVADVVMSLDNVIAVAAAANGRSPLLVLGLAISIPMIIAGAALIMLVLDRLPVLVWLGAMLLGWIAGNLISSDPALQPFLHRLLAGRIVLHINATSTIFGVAPHLNIKGEPVNILAALSGAFVVLVAGSIWRRRALRKSRRAGRSNL
ncbi:MAG: YjbE family putative metal transport protein [Bradyrhizobium sp.]